MPFRSDINGLRAIAVIFVVCFHFFPQFIPGGFIGVDIFFVISGYLMTQIIVSKLHLQQFSLKAFYAARARRILPALVVLCLVMLAFGWFLLLDQAFSRLAREVLHASTLISNIAYYQQAGYFDVSSLQKWLLHTWSLSVEWQFYLLYPIGLMWLYKKLPFKKFKLVILLACISSFVFALYAGMRWPSAAYYLLPTRAWEMLAGALVFLYPWRSNLTHAKRHFTLALGALVFACFAINSSLYWPGIYTAIVILATFLFLQANIVSIFKWQAFQYLGLWSYSIYLWHWPIVVWINQYHSKDDYPIIAAGFIASILCGFISYTVIEKPFKQKSKASLPIIFSAIAAIAVVTLIVHWQQGQFSNRTMSDDERNIEYARYANYTIDPLGWYKLCNTNTQFKHTGIRQVDSRCINKDTIGQGVFLWGDSHLGALSPGVRSVVPANTYVYQVSASTCQPSFTHKRQGISSYAKSCNIANQIAFDAIQRLRPQVVVMATARHHEQLDWLTTIKQLKAFDVKHIIVVGPVPQYDPSLPQVYLTRHYGKRSISDDSFRHELIASNEHMKQLLANLQGVSYIDVLGFLCDFDQPKFECMVKPKDTLIAFDYGHLTVEGAVYISEQLLADKLR